MLLTGEPLNMYDLDKLPKKSLIVRDDLRGNFSRWTKRLRPRKRRSRRHFPRRADVLSGHHDRRPAWSMKTIFAVESAVFDYARIRHTSNRIGLASESSLRFAKGINHQSGRIRPLSFCDLLKELAGAHEVMKPPLTTP
jgi:hypothetical protein